MMATTYISPTGAGRKDGSSVANAAPVTAMDAMVQRAGPGGTVAMLADQGAYNLGRTSIGIAHGGTAGQPVTIKGIDSAGHDMAATIVGNRALDATAATQAGNQGFVMTGAASNLVFANFDIRNVSNAFRVASDVSNIDIGHIVSTNVQRFFENRQADSANGVTATISGLNIHDVTVTGYSKGVIRLQFDTHDVKLTNITGDSAGQTFDSFAIGVHLDGTVHDVVLDHVTMLNNQNFVGSYLNGDAFATEGGTHDIIFRNTVARGSTDGGYDLKSDNTTLIGVVAEDNGRNFRIWGNNNVMTDSVGLDPHARSDGGSGSQIWMRGGADIAISNSRFVDSGSNTKVFNYDGRAVITLDNVDVRYADGAVLKFGSGTLNGLNGAAVVTVAATGAFSSGSSAHLDSGTIKPVGNAGAENANNASVNRIDYHADGNPASLRGNGLDILVVHDMMIPTGFDLAAHGFKSAERIVVDAAGSESYAKIVQHFNAGWQVYEQAINYDDGTSAFNEIDVDGSKPFAQRTNVMDSTGRLLNQQTLNDDGSSLVVVLDAGNSQAYSQVNFYSDAQGRLDYQYVFGDDGSFALIDFDQTSSGTWSRAESVRDSAGRMLKEQVLFDNGVLAVTQYDALNTTNWVRTQVVNDVQGRADYQNTDYDDGNRSFVDYDQENLYSWSQHVIYYNANNSVLNDYYI